MILFYNNATWSKLFTRYKTIKRNGALILLALLQRESLKQ